LLAGCSRVEHETTGESDSPLSLSKLQLVATDNELASPFDSTARAHVFIFTRVDCPISNRYAPEVRRLVEKFARRGVEFALVYTDPKLSSSAVKQHLAEFQYPCSGIRDPHHSLVALAGASITPEAVVFDARERLIYCGRIDDRFVALGQERPAPTKHDLEDAIERALQGEETTCVRTPAIGCYIGDLQ
jgi:hypothetical protein